MKNLFNVMRRRSATAGLDQEMRDHIREITEELTEAGMPPEAARREAVRRFGNMTSLAERSRDAWRLPRLDDILVDVRYALRSLRKAPVFTAAVVLPLALGIGGNTAIFTVVHAALLRSLPYREPDRLVQIFELDTKRESTPHEASFPDYLEWSTARASFVAVSGYAPYGSVTLGSADSQPEQITAAGADDHFFPLLGVSPSMGRTFTAAELQVRPNVAVLSDSLWRRRFGGDRNILGKTILLNLRPSTVIGVLPASFQFAPAGSADVWVPASPSPAQRERGYWHWLQVIARLRPGVTIPQAESELAGIAKRVTAKDPEHHPAVSIKPEPLREVIVGDVRPVLIALLGTIGLVLLIACANVANLLLARASSREREIAVRASLGAGRARVVQQLMTESIILALLGGALGVVLARFGVSALVGAVPRPVLDTLPFLTDLRLHGGMLAFTAIVTLATGILFGLAPALRLSRGAFHDALKGTRGASAGPAQNRLRSLLLVGEIALSLVLLTGAGLMIQSTIKLMNVNPGFHTGNLVTAQLMLPAVRYPRNEDQFAFYQRYLDALQHAPGVRGAATVSVLPLSGGSNTGTMRVDALGAASPVYTVSVRTISNSYLSTLGIPLIAGRGFDDRDRATAPRVVLANQRLVREAFQGQDPLGRSVSFPWSGGPLVIAGIVGDENTVTLDSPGRPAVYFPLLQSPGRSQALMVRTSGDPAALTGAIRQIARTIDPDVAVFEVQPMHQLITDSTASFQRRYPAFLMSGFAAIALVIAAAGAYGLAAYTAAQRRREIGIRLALGAQRSDIFSLIAGRGALLATMGALLGIAGSLLATRVLTRLLFGVNPGDPATFGTVTVLLLAIAIAAAAIPAIQAARLDPHKVLGSE